MFPAFNPTNSKTAATILRPGLLLVLALSALPVLAQPPAAQRNAESYEFISQYLTSDTLAVLDVDVAAVDPAAAARWLQEHAGADQRITPAVQMSSGVLATLRGAGVERVYGLLLAADLPNLGVALLVPCEQPETVAPLLTAVANQIPAQFNYQLHREEGLVVLAPAKLWERLRGRPAAARPDLQAALQSVDSLPHRLAVAIPEPLRTEMAALWPDRLPEEASLQLSPAALMQDFRAKAVAVKLPPEPRLTVRVITADAEAAKRVAEATEQLLKLVPGDLPVAEVITQDAQVVLEFTAQELAEVLRCTLGPVHLAQGNMQDSNQLKQIALAMHRYADANRHLPPRATANADGKLLLSWRVLILPYLNQQELYDQFHLDEAWDSPHNLALAQSVPAPYLMSGPQLAPGETRVRLPQIEGSMWAGDGPPLQFKDITDGSSNTIAVGIAPPSDAVVWTKPDAWELDEANLIESFFGDREGMLVMYLDGSIRPLPRSIDPEVLRGLLTHRGGEMVESP